MIVLYTIIIFIMVVLSACFSGTEAAYNSANNMHLRREAEEAGLNYWKDMLQKGVSRDEVLGGFIYSVEFSDICAEYGINAGSLE